MVQPPQIDHIIRVPSTPAQMPISQIIQIPATPQSGAVTMIEIPSNSFTLPIIPKVEEVVLVPGKGQELQTTLGTVMVPASQKGHPKITHVKDVEYQGKKTHVFVITMEEDDVSEKK